MRIKGELEKFKIRFDTSEVLEINIKNVKEFSCSDLYDVFNIEGKFDEYECDYICLTISKEADKFINQENLKGTLFSVLKKNVISWFELYTTEDMYKMYTFQEIVDTDCLIDSYTGESLSEQKGWGETFNLAQTAVESDDGDLILLISTNAADRTRGDDDCRL